MNRECFSKNTIKRKRSQERSELNLHECSQHANSNHPLRNNLVRLKISIVFLCFFVTTFFTASAQTTGNSILGIWSNEDNTVHIEFTQVSNNYSAKLIWMAKPNDENGNPKKDKNNPDSKLRNRQLLGIPIIWDLKSKNDKWSNGVIYSFERGIIVDCEIEMPDANTLRIKGSKGVFSKVKTWKRVKTVKS